MKHLRRFDERLDPETYRRAGKRLIGKFQASRGGSLIDYANEKEFGFYKMKFGYSSTSNEGTFTKPMPKFYFQELVMPTGSEDFRIHSKDAEDLVRKWTEGGRLSVTIDFKFMPTEAVKSIKPVYFRGSNSKYLNGFPMFSIRLDISDWTDGIEEWNIDQETGESLIGTEFEGDITHMFENTFSPSLSLCRPADKTYFGIFADRQSALKFKRELPKLIDPFLGNILDIISIVGGDSHHYEKIVDLFKKISLNGLYDDSSKITDEEKAKIWFGDNVVSR